MVLDDGGGVRLRGDVGKPVEFARHAGSTTTRGQFSWSDATSTS